MNKDATLTVSQDKESVDYYAMGLKVWKLFSNWGYWSLYGNYKVTVSSWCGTETKTLRATPHNKGGRMVHGCSGLIKLNEGRRSSATLTGMKQNQTESDMCQTCRPFVRCCLSEKNITFNLNKNTTYTVTIEYQGISAPTYTQGIPQWSKNYPTEKVEVNKGASIE